MNPGQRNKATKRQGNALIDRAEARHRKRAAAVKLSAKREMRKARRALAAAEVGEGTAAMERRREP